MLLVYNLLDGYSLNNHFRKLHKAPVTLKGDATAFVQRSKTMSARCEIATEYA